MNNHQVKIITFTVRTGRYHRTPCLISRMTVAPTDNSSTPHNIYSIWFFRNAEEYRIIDSYEDFIAADLVSQRLSTDEDGAKDVISLAYSEALLATVYSLNSLVLNRAAFRAWWINDGSALQQLNIVIDLSPG